MDSELYIFLLMCHYMIIEEDRKQHVSYFLMSLCTAEIEYYSIMYITTCITELPLIASGALHRHMSFEVCMNLCLRHSMTQRLKHNDVIEIHDRIVLAGLPYACYIAHITVRCMFYYKFILSMCISESR